MTDTASAIVGENAVAAVRQPIEKAWGLPAAAYTSEEFFRLEQRKYLRKMWMAATFEAEIPEPGDALPLIVAGLPIILVRNSNGEIKAFHNVCRHRGMMVLGEPCQGLKQFTCPYHAWGYSLDGELIRAPFFDGTPTGIEKGDLDTDAYGLVPVRCTVWHHWVFVDFGGDAPPIEEHLAPLLEFMNDADIGAMRYAGKVEWEFQANWKMVGDNWENYHHVYVHGGVFAKMSDDIDMETSELWSKPQHKGSVLTLRRRIEIAPSYTYKETGLPLIPFPEGKERVTAPNFIFPNVEIDLVRDNISSIIYEPVAPDRTTAKMGFFFLGGAATSQEHAEGRKTAMDRWLGPERSKDANDGVRNQDFRIWEAIQIAKGSPAADANIFSPLWEGNPHYFHNHILDYLEA